MTELRKRTTIINAFGHDGCVVFEGKYKDRVILLVQTGLGKERAEAAAGFVLGRYPVKALISIGFGGALTKELKGGDIILCSNLNHADGMAGIEPKARSYDSDASLVSRATEALTATGIKFYQGAGLTTPGIILTPRAKRDLGRNHRAQVVDMESYWLARIASDRRIPFLTVRAISDRINDSFPPFERILAADGSYQLRRVLPYFASHPRYLVGLPVLYRNSRRASKSLVIFIDNFLPRI